jgi:hypothetical protein
LYDTTYWTPGSISSGFASLTCCQPERVSDLGVAVASLSPSADQTVTRWALRSPRAFRKRTASSVPALLETNFRPSSTWRESGSTETPETSVDAKKE